ncbi:MAG: SAF domain-containing protein [Candidatus Pacebacteria bacterium]|nr:SAF domain-containing protein [Candidatus Paceibacterota bacterium]
MKEKFKKFNKISNYKIVALCVLLIAGVMYYYEEIRAAEIERVPTVEVVVLKNNVAENTVITEEMVSKELRYLDKYTKDANIIKVVEDIVGKRTRVPLYKGELISGDRLLVNDSSMDEQGKTKISLQINEVDRSLGLKKGEFIDIWASPIVSELDPGYIPAYKVFDKVQIIEIVNTNKQIIDPNKEYENIENKVPLYVVVQLNDKEIKILHDIDKTFLSTRFAKYKENELYTIADKKLQEQINEEPKAEAGEENGQGNN